MHRPFTRWTADTQTAFLMALRATGQARKAAEAIGRSLSTAYRRRSRDGAFRARWDAAVAEQQTAWIDAQAVEIEPAGPPTWQARQSAPAKVRANALRPASIVRSIVVASALGSA